ncbi:putative NT-type C2 domain-containing protein [Helianthus annuus]|nr:putative NT-type C2 domain-containing protein [Helianthus annuus]
MKGKGLMIALLQEDTAKPAAKLKKVPIVDGTCTWEEPVYEMVKLVKDQKTETYKERIYYFNVQTGSSKSGFVGEVGVDFANFVGITEPVQLSLPLTTSNNGAILHVSVIRQLIVIVGCPYLICV